MNPPGVVVYEGPSELTGDPIVSIITNKSKNVKTGDMLQLWILDAGQPPHLAAADGSDESVCGNCSMRLISTKGTSQPHCYVTLMQAPNNVWKSWKAGNYPRWNPTSMFGKPLRFGAYGDPAALPQPVIEDLILSAARNRWTGYTHQWKKFPQLMHFFMASVDSEEEQLTAGLKGWRTFRVINKGDALQPLPKASAFFGESSVEAEISCPASKEAGQRTTCIDCLLCDGNTGVFEKRKNICIEEH